MHTTRVNKEMEKNEVKMEKWFRMNIVRLFGTDNIELWQFTRVWWKWRPNSNLENRCYATKSNNRVERTYRTNCIVAIQLFWSWNRFLIERWDLHHLGYNVSVSMNFPFFSFKCLPIILKLNLGVWFVSMFSLQILNLLVLNFFRPEFKCWPLELIEKLATGKYLMAA